MYSLSEPIFIGSGATKIFYGKYTDDSGNNCNATEMITPAPTTDYLIVETNFQDPFYTLSLINEFGMNVYQDIFYDNRFEIGVMDLKPGLYYVCISNKDRSFVESRKIVIQ